MRQRQHKHTSLKQPSNVTNYAWAMRGRIRALVGMRDVSNPITVRKIIEAVQPYASGKLSPLMVRSILSCYRRYGHPIASSSKGFSEARTKSEFMGTIEHHINRMEALKSQVGYMRVTLKKLPKKKRKKNGLGKA